MTTQGAGDLSALLTRLLAAWESEVVEFKQAAHDYSTDEIGRYFSALANEANHCKYRFVYGPALATGTTGCREELEACRERPIEKMLNSIC